MATVATTVHWNLSALLISGRQLYNWNVPDGVFAPCGCGGGKFIAITLYSSLNSEELSFAWFGLFGGSVMIECG